MDFAGNSYYDIHRILLSSIGLWPYQDSTMQKIQRFVSSIILVPCVVVQLIKFVTTEYTLDLLLKVFSCAIPCIIFILKYVSFCIDTERVRNLVENITSDWSLLKSEDELEIIKRYSGFGRRYTITFALITYCALFICMLIQFTPNFLDVVAPRNESRSHSIPITAEYFADQQKYYLPILLHIDVVVVVGSTVVVSTESLFIAYIQHTIGMFEIARIEHAFDEILSISESGKNCSYCTKIISAVNIHRRAIMLIKYLRSSFVISYFFLLLLGITSLSVNLLRVFLATQFFDDLEELIAAILFVFGHIYYAFLSNYTCQKLIDHSTDIFHRTYMSQWYVAPLHTQKLLLFIMQRSMKGTVFSLGGIFVPSLEGFATMTSMSFSYFTVILSTQY